MTAAARPVLRDALRGTREEMGSAAYSACFPSDEATFSLGPSPDLNCLHQLFDQ